MSEITLWMIFLATVALSVYGLAVVFCPAYPRWRNRRKFGCDDPTDWHDRTLPNGAVVQRRYVEGRLLDIDMDGREIRDDGWWEYRTTDGGNHVKFPVTTVWTRLP